LDDRLTTLLTDLDQIASVDADQRSACARRTDWLQTATVDEIDRLFRALLSRDPPTDKHEDALLAAVLIHVVSRQRGRRDAPARLVFGDLLLQAAVMLYRHLGPKCQARDYLPCLLTGERSSTALTALGQLMAEDPPNDANAVASIFAPLFQRKDYDPNLLFPRILDGLKFASVAAPALDLANYVTRQHLVSRHPGSERLDELLALLGGLVGHLGRLESSAPDETETPEKLGKKVSDGVGLAVSLCDALALIGDGSAVGKLYQAMDLGHRRLRAEAAAALARLGEEAGVEALAQLAAEPVVRLRVLAYCQELSVLDNVDAKFTTAEAQAEAELALWLAQPAQMGIPPTKCELFDQRSQYWPGYDDPVDCHLFRFTYKIGDFEFSNIGIAGPLTRAFGADLSDLPPDDIYAAFAGWHAEHEEISEVDVDRLDASQRTDVVRLERRLRDEGYDGIQPDILGIFLGDRTLVSEAVRDGMPGVAVVDNAHVHWFPQGANRRPLGSHEAYCIYKGRELLQTFNR